MTLSRALLIVALLVLVDAGYSIAATPPVEIRADAVTSRERGDIVEARGHVVITSGRIVIRADHAVYTRQDGHVVLTGHVSATTPQGSLRAGTATAHLGRAGGLDTVDASDDVLITSQGRTLKADSVAYHVNEDTLVASGNVVLTVPPDITASARDLVARGRNTVTLTGRGRVQNRDGFIEGNRVEVLVAEQTAHARGSVVGVFGNIRVTAGTATLTAKEGKVLFRDGVTVVQPGRSMNATRVTVFYRERRLIAEGETNIRILPPP